ncbi:MAG: V-type ATP synthase subunit E [Oscillospiraceae bacterium]|jgi:vacuolar-type H+-ATPase subunit E/Vma4|nr:V-type ATP synthase subunit E [Oscillospiraceae bacterium]
MPENTAAKTEAFQDAVTKRAQAEINRVIEAAESERESIITNAREYYINFSFDTISKRSAEIKTECWKRVSRANADANRAVLRKRAEMVDDFFRGIRERLAAFTETPEYAEFLERRLDEANGEKTVYNWVIMQMRERDLPLAEPLLEKYPGLRSEASPAIKLGGFILHYQKERQYLDKTLDRFLEREKENFIFNGELIV